MSKRNRTSAKRYGIWYKSHGQWVGPYQGKALTLRGWSRFPQDVTLVELRNRILKSQIELRPVS